MGGYVAPIGGSPSKRVPPHSRDARITVCVRPRPPHLLREESDMVTVGLLVRLAAKPGNEAKVTS